MMPPLCHKEVVKRSYFVQRASPLKVKAGPSTPTEVLARDDNMRDPRSKGVPRPRFAPLGMTELNARKAGSRPPNVFSQPWE